MDDRGAGPQGGGARGIAASRLRSRSALAWRRSCAWRPGDDPDACADRRGIEVGATCCWRPGSLICSVSSSRSTGCCRRGRDGGGLRLLGPLELVGGDGVLVVLGARRSGRCWRCWRCANESVSEDRLVGALWGDDAPRTATRTLQAYLSRLRKLWACWASRWIRSPRAGGRIAGSGFGCGQGRCAGGVRAGGGVPGRSSGGGVGVRRRVAVLAGPPFGGVRGPSVGGVGAVPARRGAAAGGGGSGSRRSWRAGGTPRLIGELEAICRAHPLRERPRAQLMLALYRSGRQAEALRVFQELRRTLGESWGLSRRRRWAASSRLCCCTTRRSNSPPVPRSPTRPPASRLPGGRRLGGGDVGVHRHRGLDGAVGALGRGHLRPGAQGALRGVAGGGG